MYQTCSGAADIMMHTMERYFTNVTDVQLIDRISEGLLVTVKEEALKIIGMIHKIMKSVQI